ncbi:MAG: glycosyltransferase family 2 protein [Pigmentiphaga sp.]|uniref:Glycosyltransferase family 2 protein n=1 Tax=Pigmentiphaga daeguensis TaxID=414049 RepID=A0ABN1BT93_9BURK
MQAALHVLLFLLALPPILACAYIALLTLLSARLRPPPPGGQQLRFDILVPAHDEEQVIARTVASLRKLEWPAEQYRIVVIADNCTDQTASVAREHGATVFERHDASRRGKGYALQFGMSRSAMDGFADAVVVIDADTVTTPNLLAAFASRIADGASAMQANYGVLNPNDSWRTRTITIAYGAFHAVRSRARERLGVSCGLRGNGMGFTRELLNRLPFTLQSMAEDLEYGIVLGLEGVRVHYVDEAEANAELLPSAAGSDTQRHRWEGGRFAVARAYTGRLLARAVKPRGALASDLALDLLTPPLGYIGLQVMLVAVLATLASIWQPAFLAWLWACVAMILVLAAHILRGWQLCPLGPSALLDLTRAPFFVLWKLGALFRHRRNKAWVKTRRLDE